MGREIMDESLILSLFKSFEKAGMISIMRKKIITACAVLLGLCLAAGISLGYGNMMLYPDFNGYKPSKPFSDDEWAADRYRREVMDYVSDCEEYVQNAQNDIQTIQRAIQTAIADANDVVEEYNRFVRTGY